MQNPIPARRPRLAPLARAILGVLAATAVVAGSAHAAGVPRPGPAVDAGSVAESSAPGLLLLRAGTFDPLSTSLPVPDLALATSADSRYGIAQFHAGRIPSAARLAALGVEVLAYLPHNAYLMRWNGARAATAALPEARWVGPYLPGYKFDPALWSSGVTDLTLIGFPGTNADHFSAALDKLVPGLVRISHLEDSRQPRVHVRVPAASLRIALLHAALLSEVMFIEPYAAPQLLNDDSYGPIQSNTASSTTVTTDTPIWNQGITGSGQIVTVADTGLDRNHCAFVQLDKGAGVRRAFTNADDPAVNPLFAPPNIANLYPDNKVLGYWVQPGATAYDNTVACVQIGGVPSPSSYHGTHVVGTVLGDRGTPSTPTNAGYDTSVDPGNQKPGDGMAPNAQMLFQDIGNDQTGCLSGIGVLDDMFEQAHRGGARIHSNSWGAATKGVYSGFDADADRGLYNHEDMLVLFAAGNSGAAPTTTGSPGNAKNVLTVGANAHGNDATIASFSSRGPTTDGRTKPELTAPGRAIVSAQGDSINEGIALSDVETLQCGAQSLSGTSMATPTVAGGAALARQYFSDGFYPTGARNAGDAYSPSGSLMKAVLMNGTSMPATLPNNTFGWGRVWLDNNLYFAVPGDARRLRQFDVPNVAGLDTGEAHTYRVDVPAGGSAQELRATLTWFDPPGTPAAARSLVNDLDLEVVAPDGATTYRGNVFTADASSSGGTADTLNNTEVVRLKTPVQGSYTLRVRGSAVPGSGLEGSTRQGYALAVSQAACSTAVAQAPAAPVAFDLGTAGIELAYGATPNAQGYQIYRAPGTCASADATAFRLVGNAAGTGFVDSKVTGGFPYAYRIRGVDGCGEGPISQCASVASTAACDLLPSFDIESVVVANDPQGSICGTQVSWSAGAPRCPSSASVRYNIYRSTQFDFAPSAATLIASGVTGTSYHDAAVDPLTSYFYVVRAEDLTTDGTGPANAGNESPGVRSVNAVASGPGAPGTYADSVEGAAFMSLVSPWSFSNDRAADGSLSYRTAADGSVVYLPEQCAALTTPPITLGAGSPQLTYAARYDIEDQWDGVVVEISNNNGATWQDLPPTPTYPSNFAQTGAIPVNACGYAMTQGAFGGTSGGVFIDYGSSLASFAGQSVRLRWRFSSDPAAEFEGFYLDKLRITNATVPGTCTRVNPDQLPTAVADAATVLEDAAATAIAVLLNDTDPDGGPRTIEAVTQPANGVVAITGGGTGLTYAPNANFCSATPDTFTYTLNGGSSAAVAMTVTCVDDAPIASADALSVSEDAPATAVPVLDNDTDIDGGPKSIADVTQPANGVVAITGGGTGLTYAPNANFCSATPDTFTYTLNGGSSAAVAMTVTCVDDAPIANADTATIPPGSAATPIPVLENDTDIDGGPKTIVATTQPANGIVVITGSGAGLTYAPNAGYCGPTADTFAYTLNGNSSATVSVSVPCAAVVDAVFGNGFESP